jgi:hypothetical protein
MHLQDGPGGDTAGASSCWQPHFPLPSRCDSVSLGEALIKSLALQGRDFTAGCFLEKSLHDELTTPLRKPGFCSEDASFPRPAAIIDVTGNALHWMHS